MPSDGIKGWAAPHLLPATWTTCLGTTTLYIHPLAAPHGLHVNGGMGTTVLKLRSRYPLTWNLYFQPGPA